MTANLMNKQTETLVAAVRAHAEDNYDKGWDVIVEAYTDAEIIEQLGNATTPEQAIETIGQIVEVTWDVRQDRQAWYDNNCI
jgi:mannitol/fructose-specific phosphotransferase system IIA component (Ntr-type)